MEVAMDNHIKMKCIHCKEKQDMVQINNLDQMSGELFSIVECRGCGIGKTNVEDHFDPGPYYPQEYYGKKNARFNPVMEMAIGFFRKIRVNAVINQSGLKEGRILDIGCGRGLMLSEFKRKGWECYGVEQSEQSAERAKESLGNNILIQPDLKSCHFQSDHFDVITLWHVFEHLSNPLENLSEIKRILKPNGTVIIEVPNFGSWQAHIKRERWLYLEAPRHLYHYSKKGLENVVESQGFSIKNTTTHSYEFGIFGMVQSLFNTITTIPNFLFYLLRNKAGKYGDLKRESFILNIILLIIFIVPFGLVGCILESLAVLCGRGSIIRISGTTRSKLTF